MLGSTLVKIYQENYSVYATSSSTQGLSYFKNYKSFDLKGRNFSALLQWAKPDVIIHCAALTNGNYCDKNPKESFDLNGFTLKKLSKFSEDETHIIYISTDAVFPSTLSLAKETDCVYPESIYGKSKELGEFFLTQSDSDFTIIRTTIVGFNQKPNKKGFVEWIINSSLKQEEIGLFSDVLFTPIACTDLAEQIELIMNSDKSRNRGVLHVSGTEVFSKYQFGVSLLKALKLPSSNVKESSIVKFNDRLNRSLDQSLDSTYFSQENKIILPNLEMTIQTLVKDYYDKK